MVRAVALVRSSPWQLLIQIDVASTIGKELALIPILGLDERHLLHVISWVPRHHILALDTWRSQIVVVKLRPVENADEIRVEIHVEGWKDYAQQDYRTSYAAPSTDASIRPHDIRWIFCSLYLQSLPQNCDIFQFQHFLRCFDCLKSTEKCVWSPNLFKVCLCLFVHFLFDLMGLVKFDHEQCFASFVQQLLHFEIVEGKLDVKVAWVRG